MKNKITQYKSIINKKSDFIKSRNNRRRPLLTAVFAFFAILFISSGFVSYANKHTDYTSYSWYVKRNSEHKPPELDSTLKFIENYNCVYIDKNATNEDKIVYFTFDAGYENGNIAKILDVFKAHNAKSAFFVLENLIKRNPELVLRMVNEGHTVCNHTLRHPDMTKIRDESKFAAELDGLSAIYKELTGCEMSRYYRPPEGRICEGNLKMLEKMNYKTVLWSFAYADWDNEKQPSEEYAIKKIMDNIHNGAVILLHPTSSTNASIMDRVLCELENRGYRLGTLGELTSNKTEKSETDI